MAEPAEAEEGAMQVDVALVRQLAELLDETHLTEIEVQDGERRIRVARTVSAPVHAAAAAPAPASVATVAAPVAEAVSDPADTVRSPMVGTAFLAAEPGARPFASVGDTVTEGQTLLIIEAMKVMNPIVAPRAGTIAKVCVENGQPIEFDQPLVTFR